MRNEDPKATKIEMETKRLYSKIFRIKTGRPGDYRVMRRRVNPRL